MIEGFGGLAGAVVSKTFRGLGVGLTGFGGASTPEGCCSQTAPSEKARATLASGVEV